MHGANASFNRRLQNKLDCGCEDAVGQATGSVDGTARRRHSARMSTLTKIEAAVKSLPKGTKEKLFDFLAHQLGRSAPVRAKKRAGLKAALRPALEGLPPDLSVTSKDRVRALIAKRHGANR